jgi:multimeric flavodoxin WrbA
MISEYMEDLMKMVCVLGSPRPKGNSAILAECFCETAKKYGAEIKTYALNQLNYRGCQACMTCKTKLDRCALKDDLTEVLEEVRRAHVLVIATPIYMLDITGQLKCFIDRTFSFATADYATNPNPGRLAPGKKLVFIQTQENPDKKAFADVYSRYSEIFKFEGFKEFYHICAGGVHEPGEVKENRQIMEETEKLAERIMT